MQENELANQKLMLCTEGTTAFDALEKGFDDLMDLCDVVMDKFTTARNEHRQRNAR